MVLKKSDHPVIDEFSSLCLIFPMPTTILSYSNVLYKLSPLLMLLLLLLIVELIFGSIEGVYIFKCFFAEDEHVLHVLHL